MNPEEVLTSLKIMDLAKQWPEFQALHDVARQALVEMNEEAKTELAERAADKAKKEEAARQVAQAKAAEANKADEPEKETA